MKRAILLLAMLALTGRLLLAGSAPQTIHVTTADELLNAIGSDRTIVLDAEGFDLTEALLARPDLYVEDVDLAGPDQHVYYCDQFDGPELHVSNVHNLTIELGEDMGASVILIHPRYAYVIHFEMCSGLFIKDITFGHTEEGYCDRGVLGFDACEDVTVRGCDLFGCGTEGITVSSCRGFLFEDSKIRDCTYHTMHVIESSSVYFIGCQFFRNREFSQVNIVESEDVSFYNCIFANNQGPLFFINSPVTFNNCVILHEEDSLGEGWEFVEFINCILEEPYLAVG